jgi:hypothetical protein
MTTAAHDPARPGIPDHRATLATARAVLARDPGAAHEAAGTGTCPECTVICAVQLGFKLAARLAGERTGVSEDLRRVLLDVITETQAALDAGLN